MEKKEIRWGLLGAGNILNRWMKGARQADGMKIVAVASRTRETAVKMAEKFEIPEVLTYEEMLDRKDIDVVYIAVPHQAHKELALRAMNAGKHVLVEKPATVTAEDFEILTECARRNQVFLMEATWTRFFPLVEQIKEILNQGRIGKVYAVHSAFSCSIPEGYTGRLTDMEQAGGGLLDIGVYNLHFARMILEKDPIALTGLAVRDTDELHLQVDEQASYIAQYEGGELAVMTSGIRADMPDTACIYGSKGHLVIPHFWKPSCAQLVIGSQVEELASPVPQKYQEFEDEGYQFEIIHVNDCLRQGIQESPMMPWKVTLSVLKQCDQLRESWGLKYPFEQ